MSLDTLRAARSCHDAYVAAAAACITAGEPVAPMLARIDAGPVWGIYGANLDQLLAGLAALDLTAAARGHRPAALVWHGFAQWAATGVTVAWTWTTPRGGDPCGWMHPYPDYHPGNLPDVAAELAARRAILPRAWALAVRGEQ